MNLKPFDLEAALRGEKVVTRNGQEITQIHHFANLNEGCQQLYAVINGLVRSWHIDGAWDTQRRIADNDLFMLPKTKTYWVNVFSMKDAYPILGHTFNSEKDSKEEIASCLAQYIKTISFTVDE